MPRPISAFVRPNAIRDNLHVVRQYANDAKIWAVVKADAYGHGIERLYPGLEAADGLALLDLEEALRIRRLGWRKPILLLEGVFESADVKTAMTHGLTVSVHCREQLDLIAAADAVRPLAINLKMNSGMNRLGFMPDEYREAWSVAKTLPGIGKISLMTHFAEADGGEIDWQMEVFDAATARIPGERSLSNSAAVLWHPKAHRDWVRPGIMLYGSSPSSRSEDTRNVPLRAAMRLTSQVIAVQAVPAGETVGYARAFRAENPMRVGVVACGYADGYPRHASTGTPIAVDGVMTRVVGRVSMDMLTVDLGPCPTSGIGSKVELWGDLVKIDDVASSAGTIGYELMCALARRVPVAIED